jgi:hypothetical protein
MTTWADDDFTTGLTLNRPGSAAGLDEPDTCTLEQYRRWQLELPLFDDPPGHGLPETVHVRDDIL